MHAWVLPLGRGVMLAPLCEALAGSWVKKCRIWCSVSPSCSGQGALSWESRTLPKGRGACRGSGGTASPSSPEAHIQKQAQFPHFFSLLNTCTSQDLCAGASFRNSHHDCCALKQLETVESKSAQICRRAPGYFYAIPSCDFPSRRRERRQVAEAGTFPQPL